MSTIGSKSPKRQPSPSLIFPAPSDGAPKSRNPVLPGTFVSTKIFVFSPKEPVNPIIRAFPESPIVILAKSFDVGFKNPR